MNVSEFRYNIEIQQPTSTKDEYGAESITYTTIYNLRAAKKSLGGSKGVDAEEVFTSSNITFEIHYRNITEDMIVLYAGVKYRINQIVEVGFRSWLQLVVEKINE